MKGRKKTPTGRGNQTTRGWSLSAKLAFYVERSSGCWLFKGTTNQDGYGQLIWQRKISGAHRLMWLEVNGPIPQGLCVLHKCDTPACCRPDHLFLGTQASNVKDMDRKKRRRNRVAKGERNNAAKLTSSDVKFVRESDLTGRELARRLGVSPAMISLIRTRKNWSHIP